MQRRRSASRVGSNRAVFTPGALLLLLCCGVPFDVTKVVDRHQAKLTSAAAAYADNLRWGRIDLAARLVEPELRPAFLALFRGDEPAVRFTDIEIAEVELGDRAGTATVRVEARIYRAHRLTEVGVTELQRWRYDGELEKWFVAPDLSLYERREGPGAQNGWRTSTSTRSPCFTTVKG